MRGDSPVPPCDKWTWHSPRTQLSSRIHFALFLAGKGTRPAISSCLGPLSLLPRGPWLLTYHGLLAGWPSWPLCLSVSVLIWMQSKLSPSNLEESSKRSPYTYNAIHQLQSPQASISSLPPFLAPTSAYLLPWTLLGEALFLPPPIR